MEERLAPTSTNLRYEKAFPSFRECPHENDIPYAYYREREAGVYAPIRHWCFLGEITYRMVFNRLCLRVKDRRGDEVPANFTLIHTHLEDSSHPECPTSPSIAMCQSPSPTRETQSRSFTLSSTTSWMDPSGLELKMQIKSR